MFVIEKDIEMPDYGNRGRKPSYPFFDMVCGDSFFVPMENKDSKAKCRLTNAANTFGRRNKMKFSARTVDGGMRVWRIE